MIKRRTYSMKRRQQARVKLTTIKDRVLESRRLARVRGGDGLGIVISVPDPEPIVMQQHNEAFVQL
jgi:hypothetical protein